jgi:hypothetical protein
MEAIDEQDGATRQEHAHDDPDVHLLHEQLNPPEEEEGLHRA